MQKYEVVVKRDLFDELGITVGRSSAYSYDGDYIRINGDIYCNGTWDKDLRLIVKANLCNEDDEIVRVDYDFDKKTFLRVGYESFSVNCYRGEDKLKHVEIYPKVEKVSEGENVE